MRKVAAAIVILSAVCAAPRVAAGQTFSVDVAAPDGTPLATDVYLPFGFGASPTVLIRTPYGKDGLDSLCFAANFLGYACVAQDTRGRFASGGEDTVFRDDGDDGRATLRWVGEQWWCNGNVATLGASALAITEYMLAPGASSELVGMMPIVATPDLYHHAFLQGGCLREALATNWLEGQDAEAFLEEIKGHRLWDAWWREADVVSRVGEVRTPALHVGGWYDIFQQGTLDGFSSYEHEGGAGARKAQYLVMGPWTHATMATTEAGELRYPPNAAFDVLEMIERWLAFVLEGDAGAVAGWPRVRVYLMGAVGEEGAPGNDWLSLDDWPPPTATLALYPSGDADLHRTPPPAGGQRLLVDPEDPVPTLGGANLFPDLVVDGRPMGAGPYDQRPVETRDDVLVFTTPPLAEPLAVVGRVRCRLWVVPDTPDLDLSVRLSDVYPDGRSMLVIDGIQRARMRCGDDRECLLTPGVPTEIEVDLWSTAMVFNAGHRVRLTVAGSNWPRFEVNPNDGGEIDTGTPIVAHPELRFGGDDPSVLLLPVLPSPRRGGDRVGTD